MRYERTLEVDRAQVDVAKGEFRAILFTGGEASDGHILNIAGAKMPERMPLFVNHVADPRTQLGSLYPEPAQGEEIPVRGEIFVGGEGAEAEIRRDLLAKMQAGHVSRMSGKWDAQPEHITSRGSLPKTHPAYVGPDARGPRRSGLYFGEWDAVEGSIVGIGADKAATLRWAEEASTPEVAAFWRMQAEEPADTNALLQEAIARLGSIEDDLILPLARRLEALEATRQEPEEITVRAEEPVREPESAPIKPAPLPGVTLREIAELLEPRLKQALRGVNQELEDALRRAKGGIR